ncbi:MAG: nucleotidyltransferase domain-containing protein [Gallionella sp.]|nr:nucleotidyltransferase domain-containing protein [Gallionella sp.]
MSSRSDKDSSSPKKGGTTDMRQALGQLLAGETGIEFAALVGSRSTGAAHSDSDWDIALQWDAQLDWLEILGKTETLRRKMAAAIGVTPDKIDLIELRRANLAMRAEVAESSSLLLGEATLAWARFLTRTWRELEEFYWERQHAA